MWLHYLACLAGMLASGCAQLAQPAPVSAAPTGAIAGQVYYTKGRAVVPVVGAAVTCGDDQAAQTTDAQGRFMLTDLPTGHYCLTVTHPHFHPLTTNAVAVVPRLTACVQVKMGQVYYLGVGIATYSDGQDMPALVGPVHDTTTLLGLLSRQFWGDTTLLTNRAATKAHIRAAVTRMLAGMTRDDYFVFYFSGHGGLDACEDPNNARDGCLIPVDGRFDDIAQSISDQELAAWTSKAPNPRHVLLILDCCYAGMFTGSPQLPASTTAALQALDRLGCTVLAATDRNELSVETDDGSLFTNYLVEALGKNCALADTDHDHAVTAEEAFRYAASRTTADAQSFSEVQHPRLVAGDNPVLATY